MTLNVIEQIICCVGIGAFALGIFTLIWRDLKELFVNR